MFQFTRPHWARPSGDAFTPPKAKFQFTRPHWARLNVHVDEVFLDCFNSRARIGRDVVIE